VEKVALSLFMLLPSDNVDKGIVFVGCLPTVFVRFFIQTDVVTTISHLMNSLSNLDETYSEYLPAPYR